MKFTIKLAGTPIEIDAIYPRVYEMCKDYLSDETPEFSIKTSEEMIREERSMSLGAGQSKDDAYIESVAVYRGIAEQMIDRDVLLFHGSCVAVDGSACLFAAHSGTGKSTHARLWREVLPKYGHEVQMVNDDKPMLKFTDEGILACGTPWCGRHRIGNNIMVPFKAVCFLHRDTNSRVVPAEKGIYPQLFIHCFRPAKKEHFLKTLSLLDKLKETADMYDLYANMDQNSAIVSYQGVFGRIEHS